MRLNTDIDQAFEIHFLHRLAFFFLDGLAEELQVHVVADVLHMAVLLRAEYIARPAQFQVAHRDFKAGAELREFADGRQALLRNFT